LFDCSRTDNARKPRVQAPCRGKLTDITITLTRPGLGLFVRLAHGEAVFVTCRDDQCVLATCAKSW
jgi:hypothetical protein